MAKRLTSCIPLAPADPAKAIENSEETESAYRTVALQGDSDVPENAEDEVDSHYVCFVKSSKGGHMYELDRDRKGPINHSTLIMQNFISREGGTNVNFSFLALVPLENLTGDETETYLTGPLTLPKSHQATSTN